MILCIDIGNSNIVIGVYPRQADAPSAPLASWRIATERTRTGDEYRILLRQLWWENNFTAEDFYDAAIVSVVAPLTDVWVRMLEGLLGRAPLVIRHGLTFGIEIGVARPERVGTDRIVDAVAVYQAAGGAGVAGAGIAVDFGTATTFNVVNTAGVFLGGAIAPGLGTVTNALIEKASALPPVELIAPPTAIGNDTVPAIQSGLVYGYVGLVEGLLARIRAELPTPARVIATGGLGHLIAPLTPAIDAYDPWLTLAGVRQVYALNRSQGEVIGSAKRNARRET
ncbi:MAG: type III pantothenate kinase [Caldilineaceae bacterium]|nr:type III pantothenate kinase [Caldilineaceae bacterium]